MDIVERRLREEMRSCLPDPHRLNDAKKKLESYYEQTRCVEGGLSEKIKRILFELSVESQRVSTFDDLDYYKYDKREISNFQILLDVRQVWHVRTNDVPINEINRTTSMYGGFPYTSRNYPWPRNEKNRPLAPFVQIDLCNVSEMTGRNYGSGLLQLWLDITNYMLPDEMRIVPKSEYSKVSADNRYVDYMVQSAAWDFICREIIFEYGGEMCSEWDPMELYIKEPSEIENELLEKLISIIALNGPESCSVDYLLGHPENYAIGSYIDFYEGGNNNFLQIETNFPMADVGAIANIYFIQNGDEEPFYWFGWGRG